MSVDTISLQPKPKVEVVFTSDGVEVVRLYGASWSDQPFTVSLFNRLAPLIRQIHEALTESDGDDPYLLN